MKRKQKSNEKKRSYKLIDLNKDGLGVPDKEENRKPTLGFFFKLLKRKFGAILRLNLMMIFMVLPIVIILFLYLLGTKTPTSTDILYAPLYGISNTGVSSAAATSLLLSSSSIQMGIPLYTPTTMIVMVVLVLLLAITWGWQNTGSAFVLRGLVRGDPVFVWSDYFYAIKKNFKQSFFFGLLDFLFIGILVIDFGFFFTNGGNVMLDIFYFVIMALCIIYFLMRFYLYQLLITFNMKTWKILKNALIFTMLGIKRNLMAVLGLILVTAIQVGITVLLLPLGIGIPIILPLVYYLGLCGFMITYAAYPVIDKYMIAPYVKKTSEPTEEDTETVSE